jgi:hypothetical protein
MGLRLNQLSFGVKNRYPASAAIRCPESSRRIQSKANEIPKLTWTVSTPAKAPKVSTLGIEIANLRGLRISNVKHAFLRGFENNRCAEPLRYVSFDGAEFEILYQLPRGHPSAFDIVAWPAPGDQHSEADRDSITNKF